MLEVVLLLGFLVGRFLLGFAGGRSGGSDRFRFSFVGNFNYLLLDLDLYIALIKFY
jgi:hypothetical protein